MNWIGNYTVKHNPLLHAGFWATWVLFFSLLQSLGQGGNTLLDWFIYYLVTLPVFVSHTYIIAYWLVPQTFMKGSYVLFITGLLLLLFVFSVIELVLSYELIFKYVKLIEFPASGYLKMENVIISGIGNHYIILVFMAIKVGRAWYHARTMEEEEQQRKYETALEIYNYQLRPRVMHHLIALLGTAVKKDQKKSPELIIQISGFLNLFLHNTNDERISLSEEVKLMEMYFTIFTTAMPGQVKGTFSAEGDFSSCSAPDFFFLPLIDYVFNLCIKCSSSCNCSVTVKEENRRLDFTLKFSSDKKIKWENNIDAEMLEKRLRRNFPQRVTLKEEKNETCWKIEAAVF